MRNSMQKVMDVAVREYRSTAMTKAFFFGVFAFPALLIGIVMAVMPMFNQRDKSLEGTVLVADATGAEQRVAQALEAAFEPAGVLERFEARKKSLEEQLEDSALSPAIKERAKAALARLPENPDNVKVERVAAKEGGDWKSVIEAGKARVLKGEALALAHAFEKDSEGREFELYQGTKISMELMESLQSAVRDAIVDSRLVGAGMDSKAVKSLTARPRGTTTTVTERGESKAGEAAAYLVPMAFMMLLWISVFSSGQYLLTTTIEEKSSRVMEVLLSAASSMQLMSGKILGQGAVGLTILAVYVGVGMVSASQFGFLGLIPVDRFVWLGLYFVMAYFLIASLMAAIGSAVNEMREAQSMMGVVMLVLIIPMMLWMPILKQPNSTFSVVASMVPPATPFVMALRLGQTGEPVPGWQILASLVIGFAAVFASVWAAAKIFRVGALMYGKPPNWRTLLRWVRQA